MLQVQEKFLPCQKILVSCAIKEIYKISIRVRAHTSKTKVFLFSLIQKCTQKVPTIPCFQVCEIITFPLAPKLNLSEGKNNVYRKLSVLLKCNAPVSLPAKKKISYHMCNLVCILQGWSEQAAGQTHRQGQEANHRKPDHRLRK